MAPLGNHYDQTKTSSKTQILKFRPVYDPTRTRTCGSLIHYFTSIANTLSVLFAVKTKIAKQHNMKGRNDDKLRQSMIEISHKLPLKIQQFLQPTVAVQMCLNFHSI